jgi:GNAT superfamily N-acetyltransferase
LYAAFMPHPESSPISISGDLTIRRGTLDDARMMGMRGRDILPRRYRFFALLGAATAWWMIALGFPAAEVWIAARGDLVGCLVLVLDERRWSERLSMWRLILEPAASLRALMRRVRGRSVTQGRSVPTSRRLWLDAIVVFREARGTGVGQELLAFARGRARAHHRDTLQWRVKRGNDPAIHLYEKCGATRISSARDHYMYQLSASAKPS